MNQRYELAITTTFGRMLAALPSKAQEQVWRKLPELQADPYPDGTERKQRMENFDDVYRWRVGKYRVFYRIANSRIILMAIEHRRDAYRHDTLPSDDQLILIEPDDQFEPPTLGDSAPADGDVEPLPAVPTSPPGDPLPRPLAEPELARLGVPADQCGPLAACRTVDELLEVLERLPPAIADRVLALALGTTLEEVLDDPVLLLDELPPSFVDVLRGHVPLHYLLDPSQEEALQRIRNQDGPFLVTGPPGSGKTLLGLLAISPLLARARQRGNPQPRALFVTFTRTLTRTLERLARVHLSAADRLAVAFKTLDSLVNDLAPDALLADGPAVVTLVAQARQRAFTRPLSPDPARDRKLAGSLHRITNLYIQEEIEEVILGRGLRTLEEYRAADRTGRQLPLNANQREAIWCVYETLSDLLREQGLFLREERRQLAWETVRQDPAVTRYDVVVVDEVHDLSLTALRLLHELCRHPEALLLLGDTGQSIYTRTVRWDLLRAEFPGLVSIELSTGHRCPPEIAAAAEAYRAALPLDDSRGESSAVTHRRRPGRARPLLVLLSRWDAWPDALARCLAERLRELRLTSGHAAVLVPTNQLADAASEALWARGFEVEHVRAGQDLSQGSGVKLLTWHNAKGLEFALVLLVLPDWEPPPAGWSDCEVDEVRESIALWRRTVYVAMTRASRALVVLRPQHGTSALLEGFPATVWESVTFASESTDAPSDGLPF